MQENITGKDIKLELVRQGKTQKWLADEIGRLDKDLDKLPPSFVCRVVNDAARTHNSYKAKMVIRAATRILGMTQASDAEVKSQL